MAARITIDFLYVSDANARSFFKGITAIRLVNGKIEEINFNVETRIEKRNDIDFIVKQHEEITLLFMEKDLILRMSNDLIKVISAKRSRGISFEVAKSKMANISFLGGVKASVYISTKELGVRHDSLLDDSEVDLPDFVDLLTKDEMDIEYEERRKRREERNSIRLPSGPLSREISTQKKKNQVTTPSSTPIVKIKRLQVIEIQEKF